ncbi:glycosyltransferase family 1 protein [Thelephora ganbajun]|uniref:Glycosyltransferase family 1 protein n=1 Tax=Thelephora ganbajun TaxID=370292 RepID=A0ACB6ZDF9_THEGA|nr:glycosyltransferase family 1 protein [Thelephora ganbajun]
MQAFVTVGSTKFDDLIDTVTSEDFLTRLSASGYTRLVVQYGSSKLRQPFRNETSHGVEVIAWQFKPGLSEEYLAADLVISHAGSGTILEVLRLNKPLIVVANETLLDNHQKELADALSAQGHLISSTVSELPRALESVVTKKLIPFPPFDGSKFARILDEEMGFL